MDATWMTARIGAHLRALVEEIGPRPPGSPANHHATDYLQRVLTAAGLRLDVQPFEAIWWEPGIATIEVDGMRIDVPPAPFGRPCEVRGPVTRLSTDDALMRSSVDPGRVVVIDGDLTTEAYFPKAFPFLSLSDQRARLERLEALRPAVVVAVPGNGLDRGGMALLEDGDLEFPYVVAPRTIGDRLGEDDEAVVRVTGALHPSSGVNVSGHVGDDGSRIVLAAHVDSKITTAGALDNAGGVAALLAIAESDLPAGRRLEFVFFNGEDHYAAPGETAWLAATDVPGIRHAINLDGVGLHGHGTTVASFAFARSLETRLRKFVAARPGWAVVEPWYESDHTLFAMRGIPSLALTSADVRDTLAGLVHTERDTLAVVDPGVLEGVAAFVVDWLDLADDLFPEA